MNILVTGGAGYIGSHAVKQLCLAEQSLVVVDNLERGNRESVPTDLPFYQVDIAETCRIQEIIEKHQIDTVMHFAALAYVGESVERPLEYYNNNTAGTVSLLRAMQATGVNRLIFSSSCAVYGAPEELPILESTAKQPVNPYGWSKLFIEQILQDITNSNPSFAAIGFRYFNVAGSAADGSLGEIHNPETHIIPLLLQVAAGKKSHFTLFGTDYETADGTCIRDFLHVDDVCTAHRLAINALQPGNLSIYNLGLGRGYSLLEVIEAVKRVTGRKIPVEFGARRLGDPASLYASAQLAEQKLGWKPQYTALDEIIATAWNWYQNSA